MKCPACGRDLAPKVIGDVTVDVCEGGCGGIWFDQHELQHFDSANEEAGLSLLNVDTDPAVVVDRGERRNCPKCTDHQIMMRHFYSTKHEVEVDECPACGGYWLDAGELRSIHAQFETDADREEATKVYFEGVFGDELRSMQEEGEKTAARAHRIANFFRFICPTSYIPGRQEWGAL